MAIGECVHVFLSIKCIPLSGNKNSRVAHFRKDDKTERISFPQKSPVAFPVPLTELENKMISCWSGSFMVAVAFERRPPSLP